MLFEYTKGAAREEVARIWSELGRFDYDDLSERGQESVQVLHLEGRHRHAFVRTHMWSYADLSEDAQSRVDDAVELGYDLTEVTS